METSSRADETTTRVALEGVVLRLTASELFCSSTQFLPSSIVSTMSARMDRDLPIPISSASMPPPFSSGSIRDLAFVMEWSYLAVISKQRGAGGLNTRSPRPIQPAAKAGTLLDWYHSLAVS